MARPKKYDHGYPSVTQIVDIIDKPGLRYWYGKYGIKHCEAKKRQSQGVGHGVHKGIERFLEGETFNQASAKLTDDQKVMLSYLTDWCSKVKPKVKQMEVPLYSHEFKFAGTPDLICTLGRKKDLVVVDWKTDSVPRDKAETRERHSKYLWQMSAYALAYEETNGVAINKGIIARASKDLRFEAIPFDSLIDGIKEFKMLREIFKRVKGK